MKRATAAFCLSWFLSTSSFADQCAWISPAVGIKVEELLAQQAEILLYCELCDGDKPKMVRIESIRINKVDDGKLRELNVNGKAVDLAYAFLPDTAKAGSYQNLSKLVGCDSSGVSSVLAYPFEQDKRQNIAGRYTKGPVTWELGPESGISHSIVVEFGSQKNGNDRGTMRSVSSQEDGKMIFSTPLDGCRFILQPQGNKLKVLSTKVCGKFGLYLSGEFEK